MRKLGSLLILLATLCALPVTSGHAQNDPASRAIRYLESKQQLDGSIPGFGGAGATEDFILGAAAAGYDPSALRAAGGRSAYEYLATQSPTTSGATAKLILAVVAGHLDPTRFGGQDLLARLGGSYGSNHPGAYGDGSTFGQSLAILALLAAGQSPPPAAVGWLRQLQDADGSWNFQAAAGATAGDTNSTAVALMALSAAGNHAADAAALAWLHTQQLNDGGFPYQNSSTYGPPFSDPDSDALVIQALVATGAGSGLCDWARSGKTPYTNLLSLQDPATGGFGYGPPLSPGAPVLPDPATTSQVPAALELMPFPVKAIQPAGYSTRVEGDSAEAALRYLASNQQPDGSIPGFGGQGATEDFVMGAAAAGYDPATLRTNGGKSAYDYLAAQAPSGAGATGKLILAVAAGRRDPRTFGGRDLIAQLQTYYGSTSPGAFGDGSTFGQSLAILALAAAGAAIPPAAVTWLRNLQNPDGSWNYQSASGAVAGDTNSTAIALMALAAANSTCGDSRALAWLKTQQLSDGGFAYQNPNPWGPSVSDADSDALVLQALVASFQDPAALAWSVNGNTVLTDLKIRQEAVSGGFGYAGGPADPGTTSQLPAALERVPFPVEPRFVSGRALTGPSGAPTATATPTATPTPTPTPTPTTPNPPLSSTRQSALPSESSAPPENTGAGGVAPPVSSPEPRLPPTASPSSSPSVEVSQSAWPSLAPTRTGTGSGGGPDPLLIYLGVGLLAAALVAGATTVLLRRR